MLLNASLTVYEHQANSCVNWGWNRFTTAVLKAATHLPQPIVFMLWGANAQNLLKDLNSSPMVWDGPGVARENLIKKAYILSSHPSPFSVKVNHVKELLRLKVVNRFQQQIIYCFLWVENRLIGVYKMGDIMYR